MHPGVGCILNVLGFVVCRSNSLNFGPDEVGVVGWWEVDKPICPSLEEH